MRLAGSKTVIGRIRDYCPNQESVESSRAQGTLLSGRKTAKEFTLKYDY
jgi:hypothetical protein